MDAADQKGITVPVHAGIMPITSAKMINTTINLSGASIPKALSDLIATYGENPSDMRKAGIEYAVVVMISLDQSNEKPSILS